MAKPKIRGSTLQTAGHN